MRTVSSLAISAAKLLFGLVLVALVLLLIPLVLLTLPFVAAGNWWQKREFLRMYAGQSFLVARGRRGWRDFIVNNLEPVLPAHAKCVWTDAARHKGTLEWYLRWELARPAGMRHPYVVVICRKSRSVHFVALHELLLPLKPQGKRSRDTQARVAEVLRRTFTL